jgi:hypothetical protein
MSAFGTKADIPARSTNVRGVHENSHSKMQVMPPFYRVAHEANGRTVAAGMQVNDHKSKGGGRLSMTERRFVLVDFRYTSDPLGHVRFYEAGNSYDMPRALAHAAAKRELVAVERPVGWTLPSILRPPEVLTESELVEAEAELKALQRHAFEIVDLQIK